MFSEKTVHCKYSEILNHKVLLDSTKVFTHIYLSTLSESFPLSHRRFKKDTVRDKRKCQYHKGAHIYISIDILW